ncbi:hypothetical protein [Petropleomorpha daqingensis]|uniref:Uncharacterized protein n=1 Tax=Petropleomorpha daqingensis TaxID=2026353 RepID=A0A853CD45_9ACTN|nr:hypothetical protein [Petropleomorpha daqingensis]NYJ05019.1 hypothetical protein [Petropleomorpha daqingensis]
MNRGPLVTLLAVFGLALVLLAVNYTRQPEPAGQAAVSSGTTTSAPTSSPPATTTSAPTTTPAATPFPAQVVYAGHTAGGEASVAVAVKDDQALAYVCDGTTLEAWLRGSAANGELALQGNGGATLTGALANGQLAGTLTVGPLSVGFAAAPVDAPAGLYRANATNGGLLDKIGWIVQPDGSTVGLRNRGGSVEPAPAFDPQATTVVVDGNQVPVERVAGDSGEG